MHAPPSRKPFCASSEELIQELESADEIVIGVPMHNFSIPSSLKLWIDQIARAGRTFTYGANGPKGLLQNKKATLLVASGGVYSPESPAAALNFVDPYLKAVLGFLGITDVRILPWAESLSLCLRRHRPRYTPCSRRWSRFAPPRPEAILPDCKEKQRMKVAVLIARILLGLIFVVFGLNGFFTSSLRHRRRRGRSVCRTACSQRTTTSLSSRCSSSAACCCSCGRYIPLALVILASDHRQHPAVPHPHGTVGHSDRARRNRLWFIVFAAHRESFRGILSANGSI